MNKKVSYSINWSTLVINKEVLLVLYILIFLSVLQSSHLGVVTSAVSNPTKLTFHVKSCQQVTLFNGWKLLKTFKSVEQKTKRYFCNASDVFSPPPPHLFFVLWSILCSLGWCFLTETPLNLPRAKCVLECKTKIQNRKKFKSQSKNLKCWKSHSSSANSSWELKCAIFQNKAFNNQSERHQMIVE